MPELGIPEHGECLCGDARSACGSGCLCEMLHGFDIADRLPAANGWTERQTAVFGFDVNLGYSTCRDEPQPRQPLGKILENCARTMPSATETALAA